MLAKRKIVYILTGGVITCLGIVFVFVLGSPMLASPMLASPMLASPVKNSAFIIFGKTKLVIPIVPTSPPDNNSATPTPSALIKPPINNLPPPTVDPSSIPPIEKDLSPELPMEDKVDVFLQHPDGKRTQVFMAPEKVEQYLANLPPGVLLVTIAPPASLMGHFPTQRDPSQLPKGNIVITASVATTATLNWPAPPTYGK